MYLSRLILNLRNRTVRRDLGDVQALHERLMAAFPKVSNGIPARAHFGVLFRLELPPFSPDARLLVQSAVLPDWSSLPEQYLADEPFGDENPAVKDISQAVERIQSGQILRFRLLANATRKIDTRSGPSGERRNGRRVPLRREEDATRWLVRKGASSGFELVESHMRPGLPDLISVPGVTRQGGRRVASGQRGDERVTVEAVLFEGRLRVTDPDVFRAALSRGIGPGKAYGCGLLSVALPR